MYDKNPDFRRVWFTLEEVFQQQSIDFKGFKSTFFAIVVSDRGYIKEKSDILKYLFIKSDISIDHACQVRRC